MKTFRLWRHILYPARHSPSFRKARAWEGSHKGRGGWWALASVLLVLAVMATGSIVTVVIGVMAMAVLLPVVFLLMSGTLLGGYNAWQTSALVSEYRQKGWHNTLATTPDGWLGSVWTTMLGVLHRAERITQAYKVVRYVVVFGLVTMGMSTFMVGISVRSMADSVRHGASEELIIAVLPLLLMFIILYLDFIQGVILGGMVGILVGNVTLDPIDARLRAVGIFGIIQVMSYGLSWLGAVVMQVMIGVWVDDGLLVAVIGGVVWIALFFAIREGLMDGLIAWLITQSEGSADEWQALVND